MTDYVSQTDEIFFADGALDLDSTLQTVNNTLCDVDDGDLFLESRHSEMLMFDDGRLKSSSYDLSLIHI